MKNIWKIILAIGGMVAGIIAIFAASKGNQSKKEFNKRVKANNDKLDFITDNIAGVESEKKATKSNIIKSTNRIKSTKSKLKNTKSTKSTIDNFEKKYRK